MLYRTSWTPRAGGASTTPYLVGHALSGITSRKTQTFVPETRGVQNYISAKDVECKPWPKRTRHRHCLVREPQGTSRTQYTVARVLHFTHVHNQIFSKAEGVRAVVLGVGPVPRPPRVHACREHGHPLTMEGLSVDHARGRRRQGSVHKSVAKVRGASPGNGNKIYKIRPPPSISTLSLTLYSTAGRHGPLCRRTTVFLFSVRWASPAASAT